MGAATITEATRVVYTTNPNVAKALEALLEPQERPISLQIGTTKLYAILLPKE